MTVRRQADPAARAAIRAFHREAAAGRMDGLRLSVRVAGGMPHQRVHEEVVVSGDGRAHRAGDEPRGPRRPVRLEPEEVRALFRQVGEALADEAGWKRFPPDSVVATVTLWTGERATRVRFPVDDRSELDEAAGAPRELVAAARRLRGLVDQAARGQGS
ncbi:MAG TPA: hypothetical protein VHF89_11175 [Solirubrobacteraceae bacterium]|nr:hypothetical protein [Solirubrobacteraceae bacterium]